MYLLAGGANGSLVLCGPCGGRGRLDGLRRLGQVVVVLKGWGRVCDKGAWAFLLRS
jgi:hypothetical protein